MEVEKRISKGGFFKLFEWNVKSRKKLFPNKSELSGKENSESAGLQRIKPREHGPKPIVRISNYSCVSSVSSDEGCKTKASGVVARLMGLDSLPDVSGPYITPFLDSHTFRDSVPTRAITDIQNEHTIVNHDNTRNKLDGLSKNPVEQRLQKVKNRPIERFQTEILPPKSARSISIAHHRLLSPVKSPGFILTKGAACIMKEAAKIIEQSPQSTTKGRVSSFGSPSVPLRIQDMKEKLEAAQKASRVPEASQKSTENRSANYKSSVKGPKQSGSRSLKDKGEYLFPAIQAKINVREGLSSCSSGKRSSISQKRDSRGNLGHSDKKLPNLQKNVLKRNSGIGSSDVLRQNKQKQNCASSKERVSLKPRMYSYQQDRKGLPVNSSFGVNKTVTNNIAENSSMKSKKTTVVADESGKKRPAKCNILVDECTKRDEVDGKNSMDVVSFTFTSPIKKSMPGSQTSGQFMKKNDSLSLDPLDDQPNSNIFCFSLGSNMVRSDALGALLEQKLEEIACRVELLDFNLVNQGIFPGSDSTLQDSVPSLSGAKSVSPEHERLGLPSKKPGNQHDSDCSSLDANQKWQDSEELEESNNSCNSNNNSEYGNELDRRFSITISSQPSFSGGSCSLSDCKTSFTSNGNMQCSPTEAHEIVSWISARNPQYIDGEAELADSASSSSVWDMEKKNIATTFGYRKFDQSSNWELDHVKRVLGNTDLNLEDFVLDHAHEVLTQDVFGHLQNLKSGSDKTVEEYFELETKLLFDCLSESLEFTREWISRGTYTSWINLTTLFQKKEHLAEKLFNEVRAWISMNDLMVDELVDKDMSSQHGRWVDFEIVVFEEGLEIHDGILSSLVDELVTDLLP